MHVVVAAVLVRGTAVLLCHRRPGRTWFPDVWDLPGGHVLPGERPRAALAREVREELGVVLPDGLADAPDVRVTRDGVDLSIWRIRRWHGEPGNRAPDEHDGVGWFDVAAVPALALASDRYPALLRELV